MKKEIDPKMHSAEHLLNRTMVNLFQTGRCFSSHIEKKKSKCDYHFHRNLTQEEVTEIERQVNEMIQSDLPISEAWVDRHEAAEQYDLARLPEDASEDIRIIRIGECDACPCIGSHVESTRKIGEFHIISSDYETSVLRIRFKLSGALPHEK